MIPSLWTVQPCVQCPHGPCHFTNVTVLYVIVLCAIVFSFFPSMFLKSWARPAAVFNNDSGAADTLNVWCGMGTLLVLPLVSEEDSGLLSKASVLKTRLGKSPPERGLSYRDATLYGRDVSPGRSHKTPLAVFRLVCYGLCLPSICLREFHRLSQAKDSRMRRHRRFVLIRFLECYPLLWSLAFSLFPCVLSFCDAWPRFNDSFSSIYTSVFVVFKLHDQLLWFPTKVLFVEPQPNAI